MAMYGYVDDVALDRKFLELTQHRTSLSNIELVAYKRRSGLSSQLNWTLKEARSL